MAFKSEAHRRWWFAEGQHRRHDGKFYDQLPDNVKPVYGTRSQYIKSVSRSRKQSQHR